MEEKNEIFGEQPQNVEPSVEDNEMGSSNSESAEAVEQAELSEAEKGVPIGKFKNVNDLYDAYNNLQAEFTRKCQRLSELEKDKTVAEEKTDKENFENNLKQFLSKNEGALLYADEIKAKVMQDESLKNDQEAFDKAWAGILYEKLSAPNKAQEPLVQNLILKDNELKNLVIENYMKQLQDNHTPVVISSGAGERVTTKGVTPKPSSFDEAKKMILDMIS